MHPFGLFVVATDYLREHQPTSCRDHRLPFAEVDARPQPDPAPRSRAKRFTSLLRRRVARATGA